MNAGLAVANRGFLAPTGMGLKAVMGPSSGCEPATAWRKACTAFLADAFVQAWACRGCAGDPLCADCCGCLTQYKPWPGAPTRLPGRGQVPGGPLRVGHLPQVRLRGARHNSCASALVIFGRPAEQELDCAALNRHLVLQPFAPVPAHHACTPPALHHDHRTRAATSAITAAA
jgi:hypothetical protein